MLIIAVPHGGRAARTTRAQVEWNARHGSVRPLYFLRTSFIPAHLSLAGAPFSQPVPSISM